MTVRSADGFRVETATTGNLNGIGSQMKSRESSEIWSAF